MSQRYMVKIVNRRPVVGEFDGSLGKLGVEMTISQVVTRLNDLVEENARLRAQLMLERAIEADPTEE